MERYYLVEAEPFEPAPLFTVEDLRAEFVTAIRWWDVDELQAPMEPLFPARLPELVSQLRAFGRPLRPIDAGI